MSNGIIIVVGCNYHTTWQKDKAMRFVLAEVNGARVKLKTRRTRKSFWTDIDALIFIETERNKQKAARLIEQEIKNLL